MRALVALLLLASVAPPVASAALPPGCTFVGTAYACSLDESGECGGVSATGAGVGGVAGAATSDQASCTGRARIVTASVGTVFVNVAVLEQDAADGSCSEGGFESRTTQVVVAGIAQADGSSYCSGASGERGVGADTAAGGARWTETYYSDPENGEFRGCSVQALGLVSQSTGELCAPDAGWGRALP